MDKRPRTVGKVNPSSLIPYPSSRPTHHSPLTKMLRIAMWSGPRNISSAMMRSWGNRPDTIVCDEPFYAHYLQQTRLAHPGADETIANHETDWRKVVDWLIGPLPPGKTIFYQKHMAHHLLPNIGTDWLEQVTNCFLIREPREMLTSLIEFIPQPTLADTGLPQQMAIFERVRKKSGGIPIVLDARDVLSNPRAVLESCCRRLGVTFCDEMLSWPAGRRDTDGIWAKHWYAKVEGTTSFGEYRPKDATVPSALRELLDECEELYQQLYAFRITE